MEDVSALFGGRCDDRSQGCEGVSALGGAEAAGDFHFQFHHPERRLGEIVGEGNLEVDQEPQPVVFEPVQAEKPIVSGPAFRAAAFGACLSRRGRLRCQARPSRRASQ